MMTTWDIMSTLCLAALLGVAGTSSPIGGFLKKNLPQLNARIEKLEPCPDLPDTPIVFKNLVISQIGFNKYVLNGKIDIREKFDKPIQLILEMYRCKSRDDPASCEYYFTFKKGGICGLLERQDNSWDYFTNGTDLPRTCPFPPKEYTIDGVMIDLHKMNFVPFFQSHWRLRNKAYMAEKLMFCVISEFSLEMVKNH